MNIFAYDPCPAQSALWLDDIRKNKMILESCQMLSTAVHHIMPDVFSDLYKVNHVNHPCTIWTRASHANFCWLFDYTKHLYNQRAKPHKSARLFTKFQFICNEGDRLFPERGLTPFANCARHQELGIDFSHIADTHAAYRLYSATRWSMDTIKLTWNHGQEPLWRGTNENEQSRKI